MLDQIVAAWRAMHPDWDWFDDPTVRESLLKLADNPLAFVAFENDKPAGTLIAYELAEADGPKNRFISIEAKPEHVDGSDLVRFLKAVADADREHQSDLWHIVNVDPAWSVMAPHFEKAGFVLHERSFSMEWTGDAIPEIALPDGAVFEFYTGGQIEVDREIADLHARSYGNTRLVPPADPETLWTAWPGLEAREYVLCRDNGQLVGYGEWFVTKGRPVVNSFVAARSHWGTTVGAAVGIKAMERLFELGHRKMFSGVSSRNTPSMRLHLRYGWRVAEENCLRYVRKF
jgi:RimJ/RimL family protein N-acetyltransferase